MILLIMMLYSLSPKIGYAKNFTKKSVDCATFFSLTAQAFLLWSWLCWDMKMLLCRICLRFTMKKTFSTFVVFRTVEKFSIIIRRKSLWWVVLEKVDSISHKPDNQASRKFYLTKMTGWNLSKVWICVQAAVLLQRPSKS